MYFFLKFFNDNIIGLDNYGKFKYRFKLTKSSFGYILVLKFEYIALIEKYSTIIIILLLNILTTYIIV